MPVPSGKEGCASRATIDLLIARSGAPETDRPVGGFRA
jgi:hypothetical protein